MRLRLLLVSFVLVGVVVVGLVNCEEDVMVVGKQKPNLLQLATSLNLTKFVEEIKKVGIDKIINHEGKLTVFAPTDEAFAHEKCYPSEAPLKDKLRFHVAWGEMKARDVTNDAILRTLLPKRTIRMNVYNNKQVVTANGRRVISTDHEAHNGVIHIISDVMSSVYDREGSVISELEDCCPHHSVVIELVKKAGLYRFLDRRGPFTFFPPDNGAFAKLHPDYINHLIKNETALRMVLLNHVVPGTVYSPGLKNGDVIKTISGAKLCVGVKTGEVQIGTAKVQMMDVTAGNGAIHTLDTIQFPTQPSKLPSCNTEAALHPPPASNHFLGKKVHRNADYRGISWAFNDFFSKYHHSLPETASSGKTLLSQMKEDSSLAYFVTLVVDAGLEELFEQTHYPWTIFAPTNSALESVISEGNRKLSVAKLVFDHVLPKTLNYEALRSYTSRIFTATGSELIRQTTDQGLVLLNGVPVRKADDKLAANNGVLFKVDEQLV